MPLSSVTRQIFFRVKKKSLEQAGGGGGRDKARVLCPMYPTLFCKFYGVRDVKQKWLSGVI
jgi:hypothetical protein